MITSSLHSRAVLRQRCTRIQRHPRLISQISPVSRIGTGLISMVLLIHKGDSTSISGAT